MPIITISRMYGSGGSAVAAKIAASLGWDLLDNNLVDAVAERLGTSRREVAAREERVPSLVQRLVDGMALGTPEVPGPIVDSTLPPSDERLIEVTRRVVAEAISRGPIVVVGRGAQAMLAERTDAIHIFCYAPMGALVARAAERHGISEAEAEKMVRDTNKDRAHYVKKHWNRDWSEFGNYHACLNTDWLGLDGAAAIVSDLARKTFRGQAGV
jgi:cytidylate kinase